MRQQKDGPGPVRIDGIIVDLPSLVSLAHRCRPESCREDRCCCSEYEVEVDGGELETIVGCLPEASRFAPHLKNGDEYPNIFDDQGGNLFAIDQTEDGCCVFVYRDEAGTPLCSLHAAALSMGLPPAEVKPECCHLWPLALSDSRPPLLGIHEDSFTFACNTRRAGRPAGLDPGVAAIIREALGSDFLVKLQKAIETTNPA